MSDEKRLGRDPFSLKLRPESSDFETPEAHETETLEDSESWTLRVDDLESHGVTKYDRLKALEVRLALPQKHFLEQVTDYIVAHRSKELTKQRITKATVIRAWINALGQCIDEIDLNEVANEEQLTKRFKSYLKSEEDEVESS